MLNYHSIFVPFKHEPNIILYFKRYGKNTVHVLWTYTYCTMDHTVDIMCLHYGWHYNAMEGVIFSMFSKKLLFRSSWVWLGSQTQCYWEALFFMCLVKNYWPNNIRFGSATRFKALGLAWQRNPLLPRDPSFILKMNSGDPEKISYRPFFFQMCFFSYPKTSFFFHIFQLITNSFQSSPYKYLRNVLFFQCGI
jgi:hypothetical protein